MQRRFGRTFVFSLGLMFIASELVILNYSGISTFQLVRGWIHLPRRIEFAWFFPWGAVIAFGCTCACALLWEWSHSSVYLLFSMMLLGDLIADRFWWSHILSRTDAVILLVVSIRVAELMDKRNASSRAIFRWVLALVFARYIYQTQLWIPFLGPPTLSQTYIHYLKIGEFKSAIAVAVIMAVVAFLFYWKGPKKRLSESNGSGGMKSGQRGLA